MTGARVVATRMPIVPACGCWLGDDERAVGPADLHAETKAGKQDERSNGAAEPRRRRSISRSPKAPPDTHPRSSCTFPGSA